MFRTPFLHPLCVKETCQEKWTDRRVKKRLGTE